jgi:hypothetical protein
MGASLSAIKDAQSRYRVQGETLRQKFAMAGLASGRLKAAWQQLTSRRFRVPIRYRDETGFHHGVTPARKAAG